MLTMNKLLSNLYPSIVPPRLNVARAPFGHYAEINTAPQGVLEKVQDEELYFLKMMAWL